MLTDRFDGRDDWSGLTHHSYGRLRSFGQLQIPSDLRRQDDEMMQRVAEEKMVFATDKWWIHPLLLLLLHFNFRLKVLKLMTWIIWLEQYLFSGVQSVHLCGRKQTFASYNICFSASKYHHLHRWYPSLMPHRAERLLPLSLQTPEMLRELQVNTNAPIRPQLNEI